MQGPKTGQLWLKYPKEVSLVQIHSVKDLSFEIYCFRSKAEY